MGFTLYATGSNSDGQLGHDSHADSSTFAPTTFLLRSYDDGNYDDDDDQEPRTVLQMAFGGTHTLALCSPYLPSTAPKLYVTGSNARGQLGPAPSSASTAPRLAFEELPLEVLISSLNYHARSRVEDLDLEIVGIASSWETSFIQLRSKSEKEASDILLSMGANDWDELGEGPPMITRSFGGYDDDEEWVECCHVVSLAQFLPLTDSYLAPYLRILDIKAGPRHAVAHIRIHSFEEGKWTETYEVVGWGAARHGQLGTTELRTVGSPTPIAFPGFTMRNDINQLVDFAVGRDHSAFLFHPDPIPVDSPTSTSPTSSSFTSSNSSPSILILLGSNKQGQLGPDSDANSKSGVIHFPLDSNDWPTKVDCSWSGNYFISESLTPGETRVHAFGSNAHGQLGVPSTMLLSSPTPLPITLPNLASSSSTPPTSDSPTTSIKSLVAGSEHILVHSTKMDTESRVAKEEVWAWGWNEHGNLGNGKLVNSEGPELVWSLDSAEMKRGRRIGNVWAGNATSWILVDDA